MGGPVVGARSSSPNLLLRVIWFVLAGWWLGLVVSGIAWLFVVSVIGLPIGLMMINRLPTLMTLRSQEQSWRLEQGAWVPGQEQRSFLVRALWFLLVGWWLSLLWLIVAYTLLTPILTMPIAFWMYERVGAVTTLYRS